MSKHHIVSSSGQVTDHEMIVLPDNGTNNDERDMFRLGKQQVLRRNFGFFSIVGFVTILQSTWESALLASSFGLYNGGTAGVIWLTIAVWVCVIAMIASMAEMASMAPTAGGQYHWVSEFAPRSFQKPLSYVVGWCCCLGWVAGIPACGQMLTGLVQGMVLLTIPNADFSALWQITLTVFLFLLIAFGFNIFLSKHLPLAEIVVLWVHAIGYIVFIGVLWGTSDIKSAKTVFTQAENGGDWNNIGLSTLVGISTPLWMFIGPDAGAHMAEELTDASLSLPRAMFWAVIFNGFMGISMLITFCFCIGDIDTILDSGTGIPVIQVLYNSTNSFAGTCILGCLLVVLTLFSTITVIAASSRQCWAFARDKGFPFSTWLNRVHPQRQIPLNSIIACLMVSLVLASINFGSDVALNAIVSVSNAALVFSYIVSIGCLRLKRLRGEQLLPRRWDLGRLGGPVNDVALIFLVVSFVLSFFPVSPSIGDPQWAADFNWAIVMFAAVCFIAVAYYWIRGRNIYVPPVRLVKQL